MKQIKTQETKMSQFEKNVIEVLRCIVPDQRMELKDGEGNVWISTCMDSNGMAITLITRNEKPVGRIVYNYETGREETFLY